MNYKINVIVIKSLVSCDMVLYPILLIIALLINLNEISEAVTPYVINLNDMY